MNISLQKSEPTYQEKSDALLRKAAIQLVKQGSADFEESVVLAKQGEKLWIKSVNKMRSAGIKFIQARGQEQLTFNQYGLAWFRSFEEYLSDNLTVQKMELAVRVANVLKAAPAKTLEECKPAIQMVLIAAEVVAPSHRLTDQTAHERNLFADFVSTTSTYASLIEKMFAEKKLEERPRDWLEKFVRTAEPVHLKYEAAKRLLTGMPG